MSGGWDPDEALRQAQDFWEALKPKGSKESGDSDEVVSLKKQIEQLRSSTVFQSLVAVARQRNEMQEKLKRERHVVERLTENLKRAETERDDARVALEKLRSQYEALQAENARLTSTSVETPSTGVKPDLCSNCGHAGWHHFKKMGTPCTATGCKCERFVSTSVRSDPSSNLTPDEVKAVRALLTRSTSQGVVDTHAEGEKSASVDLRPVTGQSRVLGEKRIQVDGVWYYYDESDATFRRVASRIDRMREKIAQASNGCGLCHGTGFVSESWSTTMGGGIKSMPCPNGCTAILINTNATNFTASPMTYSSGFRWHQSKAKNSAPECNEKTCTGPAVLKEDGTPKDGYCEKHWDPAG